MKKTLPDEADSSGHCNSSLSLAEGAAADAGCSRSSDESFVSLAFEDQAEVGRVDLTLLHRGALRA